MKLQNLREEYAYHPIRSLTPARMKSIFLEAEVGNIATQCYLFDDMEETDPHLYAEIKKRKSAVLSNDWDVCAPDNPSETELKNRETLEDILENIEGFEHSMMDLLSGIGYGFAAVEIEWQNKIPVKLHFVPQPWFMINKERELRLRNNTYDGLKMNKFGWIVHTSKAKSGMLARSGLYRIIAHPWLAKQFALRDFSEFLEIYGIPAKIGKYDANSTRDDQDRLYNALAELNRHAAGIMPDNMNIEFMEAAKGTSDPFKTLIDYSDTVISLAVLGQTLSSTASSTGLGSGVANLQGEVRYELMRSDAKLLAKTISKQLIEPICLLNNLALPGRFPEFEFEIDNANELDTIRSNIELANKIGIPLSIDWVYDKLGIKKPRDGEMLLGLGGVITTSIEPVDDNPNQSTPQTQSLDS
jgi:phage gp29-like protein